jgi:hypothetical protein
MGAKTHLWWTKHLLKVASSEEETPGPSCARQGEPDARLVAKMEVQSPSAQCAAVWLWETPLARLWFPTLQW